MVPIYINGHKSDYKAFKENFIRICNTFRDQKRALAFAFILYDFKSPQIKKVLEDKDYWNSLNSISGNYLTVFSFHYKERPRLKKDNSFKTLLSLPIFGPPENEIDDLMIKYFDNRQKIDYPAILFFQVDNQKVIDTMLIGLKGESIESSFWEMSKYLTRAVDGLKGIDPTNTNNHKEVFDILEAEIKNFRSIRLIQRITRAAGGVLGLVSSIKGLF